MYVEKPQRVDPLPIAFGGFAAMAVAVGIGRFIYTPILPQMADALSLTQAAAGLIASANFAGYLLGALLAAIPIFGNKRNWMIGSLVASALSTGLMGLDYGLPLFLTMRFLGGLASAFVLVLSSTLVLERLSNSGRDELGAVHFAGVGGGILISAAITWLVTLCGGDWRWMWFSGGGATLLASFMVSRLIPGIRGTPISTHTQEKRRSLSEAWPLVTAYGLFGFGYVITATFIVTMVRSLPDAKTLEPVVWGVVGVFAIPSVACWSWAAKRLGTLRAFAIASVIQAAGVGLSVINPSALGLLASAALLGGTFMGMTALGMIAARSVSAGSAQKFFALMTASFGVGQIIGPSAAGYGFEWTGSFFLPSMTAIAALCVAAVLTTFYVPVRGPNRA